jgi:hypothetical protein
MSNSKKLLKKWKKLLNFRNHKIERCEKEKRKKEQPLIHGKMDW